METTEICYGCMRKKEPGEGKCRYCGFSYDSYMKQKNRCYLNPGEELHTRYIVGRVLGAGGFGVSYLGYDKVLQIRVAVKEYFPAGFALRNTTQMTHYSNAVQPVQDERFYRKGLEKFLTEARNLAHFNKVSGIMSVTDFFHENGTGYMVMEYLPGQSLKQITLSTTEMMTEEEVMELLAPVMDALEIIHKEGIIHRDISPDNMLMNKAGHLTLIDFGAARDFSTDNRSLTIMLKHGYAPLEQYTTSGLQGPWTDVYALCAVMYFMITHAVPETATDRVVDDRQLSLMELGMPVSEAFSDMVQKGMAVQVQDRFQSVEEMRRYFKMRTSQSVPRKQNIDLTEVISETGKKDAEKNSHSENLQKKEIAGKNPYKYAIAILGTFCLACFVITIIILLGGNSPGTINAENGTTQNRPKAEDSMEVMDGTYVTYKSLYLDNVPIYTQPGEEKVYAMLPEGQCVQMLGKVSYKNTLWYKVDYCGKQGWIEGSNLRYLSDEDLYFQVGDNRLDNVVFVNEEKVKLHTEPEQESPYAGKGIRYGTEFAIKELKNGWGKINYKGQDCWIDMNVVNYYPTRYWQIEVCNGTSDGIHLRKSPDEETASLGKVPVGIVVRILEHKNGWGKISYGGKTGWIKLHYATPCPETGLENSEDLK